jgi:hypothetical protein
MSSTRPLQETTNKDQTLSFHPEIQDYALESTKKNEAEAAHASHQTADTHAMCSKWTKSPAIQVHDSL